MKAVLFIFGVLFSMSTGQRSHHHPMMDQHFIECLSENNIKRGELRNLKRTDDPKSGCFIACILEKKGALKDGVMDKDKVLALLKTKVDGVSEEKLSEIVDACQPKDSTDKCAMAKSMVDCGHKAIKELFKKETTS